MLYNLYTYFPVSEGCYGWWLSAILILAAAARSRAWSLLRDASKLCVNRIMNLLFILAINIAYMRGICNMQSTDHSICAMVRLHLP